jgi:hypothetical protein
MNPGTAASLCVQPGKELRLAPDGRPRAIAVHAVTGAASPQGADNDHFGTYPVAPATWDEWLQLFEWLDSAAEKQELAARQLQVG